VNLWIADRAGRDAIGALPQDVELALIPRDGDLPEAVLGAEFLVPGAGDRRIERVLASMEALKVIQTLSAGVDRLLPLVPTGVTLCDAAGARDAAVAEWVLAAILASLKELPEMRDDQREHRWRWRRLPELAGRTVLILGYGSIGAAVEARLEPFEARVLRVARSERRGVHSARDLASLLPRADVLVVLLPLTDETRGLLDMRALSLLPRGALLVNAARGQIVDTAALAELLRERRIRAALDVVEPEPLPDAHPLWDAPGLLLSPHCAGDTEGAERRAYALVGEQVRRYVRGEPLLNVVEGGY
jgi:phosphoglycerate dehydrogenase-like enzyme